MYLIRNTSGFLIRQNNEPVLRKILRKYQHTATKCSASTHNPIDDEINKVRPVFRYANNNPDKIALHDGSGDYSYRSLFNASVALSKEISQLVGHKTQERVAFLCPNDASYIITQWASWMSGQIVVPLSKSHPQNLLEYYVNDSNASLIVAANAELGDSLSLLTTKNKSKLLVLDESLVKNAVVPKESKLKEQSEEKITPQVASLDAGLEPAFYQNADAMIIYTSGTTGPPKGVVVSHHNVHAQVYGMVTAWGWSQKDIILHTLPLHHVHGITNALITPLSVGAKIVMLPQWSASEVWSHLLAIKKAPEDRVNIFMGVPTMYAKLIEEYDGLFADNKRQVDFIRAALSQKVRLMISGSAPLPEPVLTRWQQISGHTLLERYGMTETGMVLSNPLDGERRPGAVGHPLPGVNVRIVSKEEPGKVLAVSDSSGRTQIVGPAADKISGDLEVAGPNVFKMYWNKPKATAKEFASDGWFKTGDTSEYVNGYYRILGRTSVDIIKTGGFKVSALDVETVLLGHDDIQDVAVVGVADMTWGEKVAAVVVVKPKAKLDLAALREWSKERMAPYWIPTELKIVEAIPRNQMGKINKKELVKTLFVSK